jgi:hypothetical protein
MRIPVSTCTSYFTADKNALIDSGATDNFIHPNFAKRMGLAPCALEKPQKIWNVDNTENQEGMITHYLDLDVETNCTHKDMQFYITNIGKEDVLLGYPWLAAFKPRFNWQDATIGEESLPVIICSINPRTLQNRPVIAATTTKHLKALIVQTLEQQSCIKTTSTDLAIAAGQHKAKVELPSQYKRFAKVFSEDESHRFPPS